MTSSFPFGEATGGSLHWSVLVPLDGGNFDAARSQTIVPECGLGYKAVFCLQ